VWAMALTFLVGIAYAVHVRAGGVVTAEELRQSVCAFVGLLPLVPLANAIRHRNRRPSGTGWSRVTLPVGMAAGVYAALLPMSTRLMAKWLSSTGGELLFWIVLVVGALLVHQWWLARYLARVDMPRVRPMRLLVV
jgi:hypothetical protein